MTFHACEEYNGHCVYGQTDRQEGIVTDSAILTDAPNEMKFESVAPE
jgi:hypothetical protein